LADKALQQQRERGIKKLELGLSPTKEASLSTPSYSGLTKSTPGHVYQSGVGHSQQGLQWKIDRVCVVVATVSVLFRPLCCII